MQCNSCGHDRPRSGNCPHCGAASAGAPPQGSYSSLRGWKDRPPSSSGGSGERNSRPLRDGPPPPPDRSYSGRQGPNDSFARRPGGPNQSYPSRRNDSYGRQDEYDEYGDDRSLMLPPDAGAIMPSMDDRNLPALPNEDEERALGIRRPAFIPATDERKGQKPGRWRVISGVASVMFLCVAMCGLSGFLVQKNVLPGFSKIIGFRQQHAETLPVVAIPTQYIANNSVKTPGPTQTPIIQIGSYKAIIQTAKTVTPQQQASIFFVNDFVYVVLTTNTDVKAGDTISAKWFINNIDITSDVIKTKKDCCLESITTNGIAIQALFAIKPTDIGPGKIEVSYNDKIAYTLLFYTTVPSVTPTPGASPTPVASPTVKPK